MNWIKKEAKGTQVLYCIIGGLVLNLALGACQLAMIQRLNLSDHFKHHDDVRFKIMSWWFPLLLIVMALVEEAVFRAFPLSLCTENKYRDRKVFIVAAISSVFFGWLHGTWMNIFTQGFAGFLYCLIYLKCGGSQGKNVKALASSTTVHAAYNGVLAAIMLMSGQKTF